MQTERKVFEKLFSPDKVELESQRIELESKKYEFAKKAPQILADVKKANDILLKAEQKIESSYLSYKKAYADFQIILKVVQDSSQLAEKDLISIMDALQALGMSPSEAQKIDGFASASDLVTKLNVLVPSFKNLYVKPE
jgi:hypothetical protein